MRSLKKQSVAWEAVSTAGYALAFVATFAIVCGLVIGGCWGSVYLVTSAVRAGWDR